MKKPCARVVVVLSSVLTFNPPENNKLTKAAAIIAPRIWTKPRSRARNVVTEPMIHIPNVTCSSQHVDCGKHLELTAGLKSPPLILKKTQALTARENPKLKLIYSSCAGFFCATVVTIVVPVFVFDEILATCVPANAKKRKKIVPANSPIAATMCPRAVGGAFRRILFAHVTCGSASCVRVTVWCSPGVEI